MTNDQIVERVKKPAYSERIKRAKELYHEHIRHVKGVGIQKFIEDSEVNGFENKDQIATRKKVGARPYTVPIFGKELVTFEKAFSAGGFSRYYSLPDETAKEFEEYLNSNVAEGNTLFSWMKNIWGDKIHYDFNGLAMVELPPIEPGTTAKAEPYVIFKSICDIKDMLVENGTVIYVIYLMMCETTETGEKKTYRYIDAERDVLVIDDNGKVTVDLESELPNPWGFVPAVQLSTVRDVHTGVCTSHIWQSTSTADEYLIEASIHSVSNKVGAFPQWWMYPQPCHVCNGTKGFEQPYDGPADQPHEKNFVACAACHGSGESYKRSPDKVIIKPMPDANNPDIGEPTGTVSADVTSLDYQVTELVRLENKISEAIWQTDQTKEESQPADATATGELLKVNSKQIKLSAFSDNAQHVEKFLTNAIGMARYGTTYKGCVINYGHRYYILSESQLEEMYKAAKESGMSEAVLQSILEEIIYVKYAGDPVELKRQLTLFRLEPFVTHTAKEIQELATVTQQDKFYKTYFNDYVRQLEDAEPTIMTEDSQQIEKKLRALNLEKMQSAGLVDEKGNPLASDKESEAKAQLRGTVGGMDAISALATAVQEGKRSKESAVNQAVFFLGMDKPTAEAMIGEFGIIKPEIESTPFNNNANV